MLLVAGMVLVGFNLRPLVTSLGPELSDVRDALGLSGAAEGLLTTLPVLCFAAFGALTPLAARRLGPHRLMAATMAVLAAGLALRAATDSGAVFLAASALGLAAAAAGNVLLPAIVKRDFPDRIGPMTAVYVGALSVGTTLGSAITVPLSGGDWRQGLGMWAIVAAVAALPWLALLGEDRGRAGGEDEPRAFGARVLMRSSLPWAMACYFGFQALCAYVIFGWLADIYKDAGYGSSAAGLLLSAATVMTIPVSLLIPRLAARRPDQRLYVWLFVSCYAVALPGLALAPHAGAWVWAILLGLGGGAFPLSLTMMGLRTRTAEGAAALSGFAQGAGYLIGAAGPFTVGILHALTGGWNAPIAFLGVAAAIQLPVGLASARDRTLEDELPAPPQPSEAQVGGRYTAPLAVKPDGVRPRS